MEKSPSNDGIKLFGATITLQQTKQHQLQLARSSDYDENDKTGEMKRPDKIIPCPRCKSMETKFCYFNNYNVNQPRHFCKGCQRYWTAGGALRNVPVGAGRRKNKPLPCGGGGILYDPNQQHYFDLQQGNNNNSVVVVENSWHLIAAAQNGFRQVKRRRNGEVDS